MLRHIASVVVALSLVLSSTQSFGQATEPSNGPTVVTIQGEMCGGCVKKLQAALTKLPGITRVDGDVAAKTITVVPAAQIVLSPKKIWETVEGAGKKPAKLVGPAGEFLAKPST